MWEDSWINLSMKMKDMPYYHYSSSKSGERANDGTIDDLKNKFAKYQE